MRLTLMGATGTIGSAVLAQALAAGHDVKVLVRDARKVTPAPGLAVVTGDARDHADVARAVEGAEAVISVIGPRANEPDAVALLETVAKNVVAAMRTSRVDRLLFVAGAGIALPGERRTPTQRIAGFVVRRLVRWVVLAKERETEIYRTSGLAWTAVRPTRVHAGPPTGRARVSPDRPAGFRVSSGDLATVILRLVADRAAVGEAPFVSSG